MWKERGDLGHAGRHKELADNGDEITPKEVGCASNTVDQTDIGHDRQGGRGDGDLNPSYAPRTEAIAFELDTLKLILLDDGPILRLGVGPDHVRRGFQIHVWVFGGLTMSAWLFVDIRVTGQSASSLGMVQTTSSLST